MVRGWKEVLTLRNLQLNYRGCPLEINTAQVTGFKNLSTVGHDTGADECVAVRRPDHRGLGGVLEIHAIEPGLLLGCELACLDRTSQVGGKGAGACDARGAG